MRYTNLKAGSVIRKIEFDKLKKLLGETFNDCFDLNPDIEEKEGKEQFDKHEKRVKQDY